MRNAFFFVTLVICVFFNIPICIRNYPICMITIRSFYSNSEFKMPFVDTQRYEMLDHMHPNIADGGQRPEILYKAIAEEILCTLCQTWDIGK